MTIALQRAQFLDEVVALRDKSRDHVAAMLTMATAQREAGLRASITGYAQAQRAAIDRWFETEPAEFCETMFRQILSRSVDDTRRSLEESWTKFQRMSPAERKADITANEEAARRLAKSLAAVNAQLASKRQEHIDLLNRNIATCKNTIDLIRPHLKRKK
jgi:hypothetical protein